LERKRIVLLKVLKNQPRVLHIKLNALQYNFDSTESAPFWAVTQRGLVLPYRRSGATYRSYLQWSRIQEDSKAFNEGRK